MREVSGLGLGYRVDIGVVTYEAMTPQCGRSVVQVLVVRVDIGVVIYEATTVVRIPFFQFKLWRDPCGGALRHDLKT